MIEGNGGARRRKKRKQRHKHKPQNPGEQQQPSCTQIWISTYHSLLQWQRSHLLGYVASSTGAVIGAAQEQLLEQQVPTNSLDYVCESSAEEDEECELEAPPVDADYLEFLEVTIKHQEELKRVRAAAMAATTD